MVISMRTEIQRLAPDAWRRTEEIWRGMGLLHHDRDATEQVIEWQKRAVERVILDMRDNLEEPRSLEEMAEIAHLSRFHFNRVFRRITGISPRKFLATLRLEHAKRLLLTTERSITEVCFETGYSSLGTFTSHFTDLVGVTPSQWRRLPEEMERHAGSLEELLGGAQYLARGADPVIAGRVDCEGDFNGLIFVGVFDTNIPETHPCAGDLLHATGEYSISLIGDGAYFVLAVAIDHPHDLLNFFLPDMMLRGRSEALSVERGVMCGSADIILRTPQLIDPPILIALPSLFLEYLNMVRMQR